MVSAIPVWVSLPLMPVTHSRFRFKGSHTSSMSPYFWITHRAQILFSDLGSIFESWLYSWGSSFELRTFMFGKKSMAWGRDTVAKLQETNVRISIHPTAACPFPCFVIQYERQQTSQLQKLKTASWYVFPEQWSLVCDPRSTHLIWGRRDSRMSPVRKKGTFHNLIEQVQ